MYCVFVFTLPTKDILVVGLVPLRTSLHGHKLSQIFCKHGQGYFVIDTQMKGNDHNIIYNLRGLALRLSLVLQAIYDAVDECVHDEVGGRKLSSHSYNV